MPPKTKNQCNYRPLFPKEGANSVRGFHDSNSLCYILDGTYSSISQLFTNQHYNMPSFVSAVPQKMDVTTNALRRVAVVASSVNPSWGLDVETLGIDW